MTGRRKAAGKETRPVLTVKINVCQQRYVREREEKNDFRTVGLPCFNPR